MSQCPYCGSMASDGAQFCPGCGNNIGGFGTHTTDAPSLEGNLGATAFAPAAAYPQQSRWPYVLSIILGVLLLAVTVTLIIVLIGGGNRSAIKSGMGPGETLKTVYQTGTSLVEKINDGSFTKGDLLTAYDTMLDVVPAEKIRDRLKIEMDKEGGPPSMEIVDEEINGDKAIVTFRMHSKRERSSPRDEKVPMIRDNGKWKFDVIKEWR